MQCTRGVWVWTAVRICSVFTVSSPTSEKRQTAMTPRLLPSLRQHYLVQVQRVRLSFSAPLVREWLLIFRSIVKQNAGLRQRVRTFTHVIDGPLRPADCEFSCPEISQSQRMAGSTGRTAASKNMIGGRLWAVFSRVGGARIKANHEIYHLVKFA